MSYSNKVKAIYKEQLKDIEDKGIFKEERFIHSSQAADIEVEFPKGTELKKVINMCSNNTPVDTECLLSVLFAGLRIYIVSLSRKSQNSWEQRILSFFLPVWMQIPEFLKLF